MENIKYISIIYVVCIERSMTHTYMTRWEAKRDKIYEAL